MTRLFSTYRTKSAITLLLLSSMLLQSCYSYFNVTEEERQEIMSNSEDQLQVTLVDGQEVIVEPYHYVQIAEPTDGIYAYGELVRSSGAQVESFHGVLQPVRIDSTEVASSRLFFSGTKLMYYDLWMADSSKVRCSENSMIRLSKEQGAGLWVNGYIVVKAFLGMKETKQYVGKISSTDIASLERKKFSVLRTAAVTLGIGAFVTATIINGGFPFVKKSN